DPRQTLRWVHDRPGRRPSIQVLPGDEELRKLYTGVV
ncbi:MAG: hypothetical protein AVDCRST_MAG91-184, partial [uncultured Sphingomonadaceae bacterium]